MAVKAVMMDARWIAQREGEDGGDQRSVLGRDGTDEAADVRMAGDETSPLAKARKSRGA